MAISIPHAAEADEQLALLTDGRWLAPDAEMESLGPPARLWLEARADELAAAVGWHAAQLRDAAARAKPPPESAEIEVTGVACEPTWKPDSEAALLVRLAPYLPARPAVEQARFRLRVVRSMREACAAWDSGWHRGSLAAMDSEALGATMAITYATRGWYQSELPRATRDTVDAAHERSLADGLAASPLWRASAGRWLGASCPMGALSRHHVRWIALHGEGPDAPPSPWGPLMACWVRGVWPMIVPPSDLVVYVPVHVGEAVAPDPERPELRDLPERRVDLDRPLGPVFSIEATLAHLGLGPPPGRGVGLPPRVLTVKQRSGFAVERLAMLGPAITVGRMSGNTVVLPRQVVSKRHCRIERRGEQLVVTDLRSRNGTFVNERRIEGPVTLARGDTVAVGDFALQIEPPEGDDGDLPGATGDRVP